MAEQGHKARASEARLQDTGVPPVPVSNTVGNGLSEVGSEDPGMMPLRCRVSGRQAGEWTGAVVANCSQFRFRFSTLVEMWSTHDIKRTRSLVIHSFLDLLPTEEVKMKQIMLWLLYQSIPNYKGTFRVGIH